MQLDIMKNAHIVAGKAGEDRVVEYVDVLESAEGYRWLNKNSLLITALLPIRDDAEAQRLFLKHLHDVNASAVAIKPKRFVDSIPTFMLEDADTYQIPIIELPFEAVYSDLVSKISQLIINSHAAVLQETLNISNMFTEVVQNGGGLDQIALTLSQNVNRPVIIEDKDFNIMSYACDDDQLKKDIHKILANNRQLKSTLKKQPPPITKNKIMRLGNRNQQFLLSMTAIIFNNQCVGYISIVENDNNFNELQDIALENAATVTALIITTIKSNQEKESMIQYGILTDLIFGNTYTQENITAWMDYFGWEKSKCYVVSILKAFPYKPAKKEPLEKGKNMGKNLFKVFDHLVHEFLPGVFIIPQTETMILIHELKHVIGMHQNEMQDTFNYLHNSLKDYELKLHFNMCIGYPVSSLMDISNSYEQALIAMDVSEKISDHNNNNGIYFYENLDIYNIFMKYQNKQELNEFTSKYLEPLLGSTKVRFDALATLEAYITSGCSVNKSAQVLYLHVNTMKYRIGKIKEILDNPMNDYIYLNKLYIALCIHKII